MSNGEAVSRLAAQQALLRAIWMMLPADEWLREYTLLQRLQEQGHEITHPALHHVLCYLASSGAVERLPGDLWRRVEGK